MKSGVVLKCQHVGGIVQTHSLKKEQNENKSERNEESSEDSESDQSLLFFPVKL